MKVFQKMMDIGSPDPDFLLGVANVYLKMHQYDNCMQICEHVINNDINNQYVHSVLLEAYKRQNKLPELLDIYANFLQNNPYNVAFQNGLRAAQALYDKIQSSNAAQAKIEAQAVMDRMTSATTNNMENFESQQQSTLSSGEIACPKCGKGNPQNGYQCQYCGANLIE
jgi:predicted Zn-dependent protease